MSPVLKPHTPLERLHRVAPEPDAEGRDDRDGDLAAFCQREWPRLVGSLSLYCGDRDLAEELAQEALVRVCERWRTVRTLGSPSAWAHRVAFNLAKSSFRRRRVARRVAARFTDTPFGAAPIADPVDVLAVRQAVSELPEVQRRALVLRYFADLSVDEVAAVMLCPANTVKTHTRRALAALRGAGLIDPEPVDDPDPEETIDAR